MSSVGPTFPKRDPTLIAGIYNYCDAWCERCPFTARCLLFRQEAARRRPSRDPRARPVAVARPGPARAPDVRPEGDEHREHRASAWPAPEGLRRLLTHARAYPPLVQAWFDAERASLRRRLEEMAEDRGAVRPDACVLSDAFEVLRHDQYLIPAKVARAVGALLRDRDGPQAWRVLRVQTDANGSAKIALLAAERSADACRTIAGWHDAGTADVLASYLDRLGEMLEAGFPRARAFVRPGFDELPLPSPGTAPRRCGPESREPS